MELNLTPTLYASEAFKEISWRATPLIHNAKEMICNVITNGISASLLRLSRSSFNERTIILRE